MSWRIEKLAHVTQADAEKLRRDGFLVLEKVLDGDQVSALKDRFDPLFRGEFDTGIYPDEWHWREGLSKPDVTRHMCNAWKSDLTIASLALSEDIGFAAARLAGWSDVKLGQDTIWWKPPGTSATALHQDTSFMDFLDPPRTITCWFTLDDTAPDAGTIEYVKGSHLWPLTPLPKNIVNKEDYRGLMREAAKAAGFSAPEPVKVVVPAGSCVFHVGEFWHGAEPNRDPNRVRRSVGVHMIRGDAVFSEGGGGYIYRRYQRVGDDSLDSSYFPVLWSASGNRTDWLEGYCETGVKRRLAA